MDKNENHTRGHAEILQGFEALLHQQLAPWQQAELRRRLQLPVQNCTECGIPLRPESNFLGICDVCNSMLAAVLGSQWMRKANLEWKRENQWRRENKARLLRGG
jgi:Zn finger protein HypA/HybF involved in hydrogenase expression